MQPGANEADAARERNTEPLRAWAKAFGKGATTHLARRSGLTFAAVARIIKGQAQPKPYTAALLERATEGAVKAADLLGVTGTSLATNVDSATPDHAETAA